MYYGSGTAERCCIYIGKMRRVLSPGGSTFLREMTSWPPSWKCDAKSQIRLRQTVNRCETDEKWMTLAPRLHYALHVTDSVMLLVPHVHYHCLISWTQADLRSSIFNRRLRILSRRGSGSSRNSHKSNERSSSELRAVTNMSIRRNVDNY